MAWSANVKAVSLTCLLLRINDQIENTHHVFIDLGGCIDGKGSHNGKINVSSSYVLCKNLRIKAFLPFPLTDSYLSKTYTFEEV